MEKSRLLMRERVETKVTEGVSGHGGGGGGGGVPDTPPTFCFSATYY